MLVSVMALVGGATIAWVQGALPSVGAGFAAVAFATGLSVGLRGDELAGIARLWAQSRRARRAQRLNRSAALRPSAQFR